MGIVYEAIDLNSGQRVALKTMRATTGEALLRFKQEFRALQDIHHANLVRLGDLVEEAGQWWFSMELVRGINLLHYVHKAGRYTSAVQNESDTAFTPTILPGALAPTEESDGSHSSLPVLSSSLGRSAAAQQSLDVSSLQSALQQLVEGLHALHQANKVHRDIKPENVLVSEDGRVVILDFGLVGETMESESGVLGTIAYMAPEQAAGRPVGPAADWYSVGVLLYEALTGRLPFDGPPLQVLAEKQRGIPIHASLLSLAPEQTAELAALCMDLLRIEPAERPDYGGIRSRLRPAASPHLEAEDAPEADHSGAFFVGRTEEFDALMRAFAQTRSGHARTVLLYGESGVGKSALIRHFAEHLAQSMPDLLVLAGRCYEHESVPFKAIDGLIDALARTLRRWPISTVEALLPRRTSLLEQTFPVLGTVPAVIATAAGQTAPALDPHEQRSRVFAALREMLGRMAERRPLLLLIDDLQWTDVDSIALLSHVLRVPDEPPLLLLASLRPGTQVLNGTWLDATRASDTVLHLQIEPLPKEEALELARQLAGRSGIEEAGRLQRVVAESEGHPLFIQELLRQATRSKSGEIPRLDQTLWTRIAGLPEPAQQLLRLCAVMGSPLTVEVVTQASALPPDAVEHALSRLRADNLVRAAVHGRERDSGAWEVRAFEPYHDRIREVVVERLPAEEQRNCHRSLVYALEATGAQDPEALCYHCDRAGLQEKAFEYALQSASKAEQALAFERAAHFYGQALAWMRPDATKRRELLVKRAEALINAGRSREAAKLLVEATEGATPQQASGLRQRAADQYLRGGYYSEGLDLMKQAFRDLSLVFFSSKLGAVFMLLLNRVWLSVRGLHFRERKESELPVLELARIDLLRACCSAVGGMEPVRGGELGTRALLRALRLGDPARIAVGLASEAHALSGVGGERSWRRAQELLDVSRSLYKRSGDLRVQAHCTFSAGLTHYCAGNWAQAAQLLDEAENLFMNHCHGVAFELTALRSVAMHNGFMLGKLRSSSALLSRYLQEADSRDDRFSGALLAGAALPIVQLMQDQIEHSSNEVEDRIRRLNFPGIGTFHINAVMWKVNAFLYSGQGSSAQQCRRQELPGSIRFAMKYAQITRIIDLDMQGRCILAAARESSRDGARSLRQLAAHIRALDRERRPWADAYARNLRAASLCLQGNKEEAAREWEQAAQAFEAADMKLYAAVARRRQGQLQGSGEGRELVAAAEQLMREEEVRNPARWSNMLAPAALD